MMSATLILGGARSGKSRYAESLALRLAAERGLHPVYLATGQAFDAEMRERIAHHHREREQAATPWTTVEEPIALGAAIRAHRRPGHVVLVDCLTVWLTNLLFSGGEEFPEHGPIEVPARFAAERAAFLSSLDENAGEDAPLILVGNEVGLGVVPMGAVNRWFVDESGRLNQETAKRCESAWWVAACMGMPLKRPA